MKDNTQADYNQMAIEWGEKFINDNLPMVNFKCFDGLIINDSHYTLGIWIQRLKESKLREQEASFLKIKKFKDWFIKHQRNGKQ